MTKLKKKTATFNLVGRADLNEHTFKIDQRKDGSNWLYSNMGLWVDCGSHHGRIRAFMQGGYDVEKSDNVIHVFGKKDDKQPNFDDKIKFPWEDRNNLDKTKDIADMCFINIGVVKDEKTGKPIYKKFLSPYDAVAYLGQNLKAGDVVSVRGIIEFQEYENKINFNLKVNSIILSNAKEEEFKATFKLPMLVDQDTFIDIDDTLKVANLSVKLVSYFKKYKETEVNGDVAFPYKISYDVKKYDKNIVDQIVNMLFVPKEGIDEIIMLGDFITSGDTIQVTEDDLSEDVKTLIKMGQFTLEEALKKCSDTSNSYTKMVLVSPNLNKEGKVDRQENIYSESDLTINLKNKDVSVLEDEKIAEAVSGDIPGWLADL